MSAGVKGEAKAKIFVGGLKPCTTSDCLREHFSKYGTVIDAEVMMKKDDWAGVKKSRNFGFVIFDSEEAVTNALAEGHEIDDRVVEVKRADPDAKPRAAPTENINTDKIFVGGLNQEVDKDALQAYFEAYGTIVDAQVMLDRDTGRSRGFGFVRFVEKDSVKKVMEKFQDHEIGGKWVECKPAVPQSDKGGKGKGKGKGKGSKGTKGSYGDYGKGGDPYGGYGQYTGYDQSAYGYGQYQQGGGYQGYDASAYGAYGYGSPAPASYGYGQGYGASVSPSPGYGAGGYQQGYTTSPQPGASYGGSYGGTYASPDPNAGYGGYAVQDQSGASYGPGRTRGAGGNAGPRAGPY